MITRVSWADPPPVSHGECSVVYCHVLPLYGSNEAAIVMQIAIPVYESMLRVHATLTAGKVTCSPKESAVAE